MHSSHKIAISLPMDDFNIVEKMRKKTGTDRSSFILNAVRSWIGQIKQKDAIKNYEKGYIKKPEPADEIKTYESIGLENFVSEDDWNEKR